MAWATPALVDNALLISSNGLLEEIDFDTGKRRWFVDELTGNRVASATVADDLVIIGSSAKGNCLAKYDVELAKSVGLEKPKQTFIHR